ncbi:hypothetical protein SODALDRAFT_335759 [Sodiomyces alkalinus F11]|uniref:CID domain-containing protein n=1 Tax=Sodiomyces alkalinus (strain CBS 110278 / VKM F-3762 / F11) TaxID=1314773 RepID=A0A3N2PQ66_SODAK|nr:hypothetical protein SODALDRAFT_335759 [Sodiomyces alkalinus F11]ROT36653.1 hypothetical protein SODALDRAFT_335759 [Sodiomyces alkalinus F11]
MSSKKIAEFPAVEAKLQKPTKQSAFQRQRAEAEAKRAREEAETAAALREFEKSFDHEDDQGSSGSRHGGGQGFGPKGPALGGGMAAPRRHFGAASLKSGPGSLGPPPGPKSGPGSLGPPPSSYGKKRGFDSYKQERDRDNSSSRPGFDERGESKSVLKVFNNSDDEQDASTDARDEEMAVAKPTLRLSQIPPGTSPAAIKALIPSNLTVENVKIVPPSGPSTDRKCTVAIVTLSQETPASDIDAAVSALQNRYLGYGFYLSLHRHLSSAVASSISTSSLGVTPAGSRPFGAKPVAQRSTPGNAHTQHAFHRGFAPPTAYGPSAGGPLNRNSILHVPVKPPNDIKMLRLINKTLESVLEHGPEFEALLMSRPEVQREEKWAWIWDARSEGGIWYRWRMWEIVTGASLQRNKGKYLPVFDGSHAWKAPEKGVPFEYTTSVDEFVSDSEYNSSDDEDLDGDGNREQNGDTEAENTFLNPLDKAKLTHLLSRLPTTLSRIRKGDIARVTAFALTHASRGADEVVDMIVSNIEKPLALTSLNPEHSSSRNDREKSRHRDESEAMDAGPDDKAEKETAQDTSGASLVSLYVVNDILASSSTSGVRHAWRFRQIFEGALKERKTFEMLGLMAEKLNWGRLRAEKWKRSVGMILHLWEGWCVFPAESQDLFTNSFNNPPATKAQEEQGDDERAKKGRWKVVDAPTSTARPRSVERATDDDVQGEPMDEDDVEGEPMDEDDVEGEPMEESDVEGEPLDEDDILGETLEEDGDPDKRPPSQNGGKEEPAPPPSAPVGDGDANTDKNSIKFAATQIPPKSAAQARRRMRAVDMFAEPEDTDNGT